MRKIALLALLTAVGLTGCRMCADCFDYAGPVHEAPYANDGTYGRAGSGFSGQVIPAEGEVIVNEGPTLAEPPAPPTN